MSAINDLVKQISNPELRSKIEDELNKLVKQKKFGLVFEEHLPETTVLYDIPVKKGATVSIKTRSSNELYRVAKIEGDKAVCVDNNGKINEFAVDELVTTAKLGEPIYPYLKKIDECCNAPDSPLWHILIEAENYHALQLLVYLYGGKVDCIYIDPPYNTGAKDWKYNNDYVDSNDAYRHSKWLSMIRRRLELARKLLNPNDSVLIVTIDEKEYLHLGCLLEDLFPQAYIQMITIVNNPKGSTRDHFSRVEEYAFYVFLSNANVCNYTDPMIGDIESSHVERPRWKGLLRSGKDASRADTPALFYPILINDEKGVIVRAEKSLPLEEIPNIEDKIDGYSVAWPIRDDGSFGRWMLSYLKFNEMLQQGYISLGKFDPKRKTYALSYLTKQHLTEIQKGILKIVGYTSNNQTVIVEYPGIREKQAKTVWCRTRHDAGAYGTDLIKKIIGQNNFTFPKSLYSVLDSLRFVVANKKNAIILDFFAGSGTTQHAVELLNLEDGGNRKCISVTNNEVSADEQKEFIKMGLTYSDELWEQNGIARSITWPRIKNSIMGKDEKGIELKGNYGCDIDVYEEYDGIVLSKDTEKKERKKLFYKTKRPAYPNLNSYKLSDGFKTNAIFFKLGFLDRNQVSLGSQFKELISLLWMKAGSIGPCPTIIDSNIDYKIFSNNQFAVLLNENKFAQFLSELNKDINIFTVYLVTDSESGYREMISHLPLSVKNTYQLYSDYLDNFRIISGR